jgi:hypothetical protein
MRMRSHHTDDKEEDFLEKGAALWGHGESGQCVLETAVVL